MKSPHHIMTRGAFGRAALVPQNEIPLCYKHHSEVHNIGRRTFEKKYHLERRFREAFKSVTRERERLGQGNIPSHH